MAEYIILVKYVQYFWTATRGPSQNPLIQLWFCRTFSDFLAKILGNNTP